MRFAYLPTTAAVLFGWLVSGSPEPSSKALPPLPFRVEELEILPGPHRLLYAHTAYPNWHGYVCHTVGGPWRMLPRHDSVGKTRRPNDAVLVSTNGKSVTLFDAWNFRAERTWHVDRTVEGVGSAVVSRDGRTLAYVVGGGMQDRIRLVGPDGKERDTRPWGARALNAIAALSDADGTPRRELVFDAEGTGRFPGEKQWHRLDRVELIGDDPDGNLLVSFWDRTGRREMTSWTARLSLGDGELMAGPWPLAPCPVRCGDYGDVALCGDYRVGGSDVGIPRTTWDASGAAIMPDARLRLEDPRSGRVAAELRPPRRVPVDDASHESKLAAAAGGRAVAYQFVVSKGRNGFERATYVTWVAGGKSVLVDRETPPRPKGEPIVVGPSPALAVAPDATWMAWLAGADGRTVRVARLNAP